MSAVLHTIFVIFLRSQASKVSPQAMTAARLVRIQTIGVTCLVVNDSPYSINLLYVGCYDELSSS